MNLITAKQYHQLYGKGQYNSGRVLRNLRYLVKVGKTSEHPGPLFDGDAIKQWFDFLRDEQKDPRVIHSGLSCEAQRACVDLGFERRSNVIAGLKRLIQSGIVKRRVFEEILQWCGAPDPRSLAERSPRLGKLHNQILAHEKRLEQLKGRWEREAGEPFNASRLPVSQ